jgi:hypothetical protein
MSPFKEATYDQLSRLLKLFDRYLGVPGGLSLDIFWDWVKTGYAQPECTTEETLQYWEQIMRQDELP